MCQPHGLLLSCQQIKQELEDAMRKELDTISKLFIKAWRFEECFDCIFPGRLFSGEELLVNIPYLPEESNYMLYMDTVRTLWKSSVRKAPSLVGSSEGTPTLDEQRGRLNAEWYLYRIAYVFDSMVRDHVRVENLRRFSNDPRGIAPGVTLKFKDDVLAVQAVQAEGSRFKRKYRRSKHCHHFQHMICTGTPSSPDL
jgi:hypothetical protein